jgi:putative MFS transporter
MIRKSFSYDDLSDFADDGLTFQKAVNEIVGKTTLGKCQSYCLGIIGAANVFDGAVLVLLNSIVECMISLQYIDEANYFFLVISVHIGEISGYIIGSVFGDYFGRKPWLITSLSLRLLIGLLTKQNGKYSYMIASRLLIGLSSGCYQTIGYDLCAEFLPTKLRAKGLTFLTMCYPIGFVIVLILSWMLANKIGWQVLTYTVISPSILCIFYSVIHLRESPLWLVSKGQYDEAENVLVSMDFVDPHLSKSRARSSSSFNFIQRFNLLISHKFHSRLLCLMLVWFVLGYAYTILNYSVSFYLKSASKCEFSYPQLLLYNAGEFLGGIITYNCIDKVARNIALAMMLGYSLFFALLYAVTALSANSSEMSAFMYTIGLKACLTAAIACLWIVTVELFPTQVCTTVTKITSIYNVVNYFQLRVVTHAFLAIVGKLGAGLTFST